MKQLTLTNGVHVLISDSDYEHVLGQGKWYYDSRAARAYARKRINGKLVYMHRFILGDTGGFDIDHIDGNGLNNQRENLRLTTRSRNNLNNHNMRIDNKSGYRGVYYDNYYGCWKAEIKVDKRKYTLGSFLTPELAYEARLKAETRMNKGLSPK